MKTDIRNLSYDELVDYLDSVNEKRFKADQIFSWLYHKCVDRFDQMSNLSSQLREQIKQDFTMDHALTAEEKKAGDGTKKFLFELIDGEKIESVLIPSLKRSTICISTQAGCKFGCRFCASGVGGWRRNLTCAEILDQILYIKKAVKERSISHLAFMGVGEPLDNYDELLKAIRIINGKKGLNIGARRITISTCGVIPKIKKLSLEGLQVELAISLHGYDNRSRNVLMPVNKKYPFDELINACREYIKATKRQITFEYILIKDVTCCEKAIQSLQKAFKGLICKMNLIPYNPVSEFDHETLTRREIYDFRDRLNKAGILATVRMPRGRDVSAACGQLRLSSKAKA